MLNVSGFSGHLAALNGAYAPAGENHSKPVYRKRAELEGAQTCCVYYWDERDGDALAGWWMAPEVGGEQVWAHCVSKSPTPPASGWKVPWHATSIDPAVTMTVAAAGQQAPAPAAYAQQAAYQQAAYQQAAYQQAAYAARGGVTGPPSAQPYPQQYQQMQAPPAYPQAYGQPGGYGQQPAYQQGGYSQYRAPQAQKGWGQQQSSGKGKGGKDGGKDKGGKDKDKGKDKGKGYSNQWGAQGAQAKQVEDRKMKALISLTSSSQIAEKAAETLRATEGAVKQSDLDQAKQTVATVSRLVDMHCKSSTACLAEDDVAPFRAAIAKCQSTVESMETMAKMERQRKLAEMKTTVVSEAAPMLDECTTLIKKGKEDSAVLLSDSELSVDDILAHKEKTDASLNPAMQLIHRLRAQHVAKFKEANSIPMEETVEIKESLASVKEKIEEKDKEIKALLTSMRPSVMKAQQAVTAKKKEEEQAKLAEERARVREWNAKFYAFTYQMNNVIESVRKAISDSDNISEDVLKEKISLLMGYKVEIKERMDAGKTDVMQQTRNSVNVTSSNLDKMISSMKSMMLEKHRRDEGDIRGVTLQLSIEARNAMGEKNRAAFFKQHFGSAKEVDLRLYTQFVKKFNTPSAISIPDMFKATTSLIGPNASTMTMDDFFLHVINLYFRVQKQTFLSEEETFVPLQGTPLEVDSFVQILGKPVEVTEKKIIRVKVRSMKDGSEGWTTMTELGQHSREQLLVPYYPHYVVVQDTVLTDTFDMKKFNVVARVKQGDNFRATELPSLFTREGETGEDSMTRVMGVKPAIEGEEEVAGYVTLTGNKGSTMFRHMAQPTCNPVGDALEPTAFDSKRFESVLGVLAELVREGIKKQMSELEESKEKVLSLFEEIKEMGESEPEDEEADVLLKACDRCVTSVNNVGGQLRNQLQRLARDCQFVESGPYATLYKDLDGLLEVVNTNYEPVDKIKVDLQKAQSKIRTGLWQRRNAREEKERNELAERLTEGMSERSGALSSVFETISALNVKKDLVPSAAEIEKHATDLKTVVEDAQVVVEGCETWIEENKVAAGNPRAHIHTSLSRVRREMSQLWATLQAYRNTITTSRLNLEHVVEPALLERMQIDIALALAEHMKKSKIKPADLFAKIAQKKDLLSVKDFESFLVKKLKLPSFRLEKLLISIGAKNGLTKEALDSLLVVRYRVQKRCLLTDSVPAKSCKRIRPLDVEEIVQLQDNFMPDKVCDIVRFKCVALKDDAEGYIAVKGNKGSQFVSLLQQGYKVVKTTVLSEQLSLETAPKIVRKLKEGEILRMLEPPTLDEKTNLRRVKAMALGDNAIGYVSILGNQGAVYLENCPIPEEIPIIADLPMDEEKEKEPELEEPTKDEEEKADTAKEEKADEAKEEKADIEAKEDVEMKEE